ncbi:hypothetical protein JCM30566_02340 [Marinitoga arctica]
MKNLSIFIFLLYSVSIIFGEIVDVKPASPVYPHVYKTVEAGIMETDTEGKFNGAISVSRYDLAIFGSKLLDYLDMNYKKRIETLDSSLTKLETEKLPDRVYTMENFIFSLDADYKTTKDAVLELSSKVKNLENAITINSTDSNNPIFNVIAQNAYIVAEEKAVEKINELYETTLASIVIFSDRMNDFETAVEEVLNQFAKTKEYMTNTLDDYLTREKNNYKSYIDGLFNKEKEGLKLYITNEVSAQMRWKKESENATITQLINEINNLKNEISYSTEYIDNIIQQKFDLQVKPLINLTTKIPELDNQIKELSDKIIQLETSGVTVTDYSTISNDSLLLKKLQTLENKVNLTDSLMIKIDELEKIINSYSNILSDSSNRLNTLDKKFLDIQKEFSNIKTSTQVELPKELLDRLSILEEKVNNMAQLQNAADEINSFNQKLHEYDQRIALLEGAAFDKKSESISNLFTKLDQIEARINTNDYAVSNLTEQVLNMAKDFDEFKNAINENGIEDISSFFKKLNTALPKLSTIDEFSMKNLQENVLTNTKSLYELKSIIDKETLKINTFENRLKALEGSIYNLKNLPANNQDTLKEIINEMVSQSIINKSDEIRDYVYMQIKDDLIKDNMKSLESILVRLNNVEQKVDNITDMSYLDEKVISMEKEITNIKSQNNRINNELLELKTDQSVSTNLSSKIEELEKRINNQNILNNIIYGLIGGIVGGLAVFVVMGGM